MSLLGDWYGFVWISIRFVWSRHRDWGIDSYGLVWRQPRPTRNAVVASWVWQHGMVMKKAPIRWDGHNSCSSWHDLKQTGQSSFDRWYLLFYFLDALFVFLFSLIFWFESQFQLKVNLLYCHLTVIFVISAPLDEKTCPWWSGKQHWIYHQVWLDVEKAELEAWSGQWDGKIWHVFFAFWPATL